MNNYEVRDNGRMITLNFDFNMAQTLCERYWLECKDNGHIFEIYHYDKLVKRYLPIRARTQK